MLTQQQITTVSDPLFSEFHEIYTDSFPAHEQRSLEDLADCFAHPDFCCDLFLQDDHVAAFTITWKAPHFIYLEHFAIARRLRNGGIGKCLLNSLTEQNPGKVILEIDPVTDDTSQRRLDFYERNGFVANRQYDYVHPPYKPGATPYPLLVMSHLHPLSPEQYESFVEYHHRAVIGKALR